MTKVLAEEWAKRDRSILVKTPEEAVTLASVVEKETAQADERARVAGVFYNRLKKGMPLQSDPTVIFAVTLGTRKLNRGLTYDDLKIDSPYNTYLVKGLPPGPIANPGRDGAACRDAPAVAQGTLFRRRRHRRPRLRRDARRAQQERRRLAQDPEGAADAVGRRVVCIALSSLVTRSAATAWPWIHEFACDWRALAGNSWIPRPSLG